MVLSTDIMYVIYVVNCMCSLFLKEFISLDAERSSDYPTLTTDEYLLYIC